MLDADARKHFEMFYGQARRNPLHFYQMTQDQESETDLEDALWKYLSKLREGRCYGIAELHYQDGRIVRVKKQEVVLPKDLLSLAS